MSVQLSAFLGGDGEEVAGEDADGGGADGAHGELVGDEEEGADGFAQAVEGGGGEADAGDSDVFPTGGEEELGEAVFVEEEFVGGVAGEGV